MSLFINLLQTNSSTPIESPGKVKIGIEIAVLVSLVALGILGLTQFAGYPLVNTLSWTAIFAASAVVILEMVAFCRMKTINVEEVAEIRGDEGRVVDLDAAQLGLASGQGEPKSRKVTPQRSQPKSKAQETKKADQEALLKEIQVVIQRKITQEESKVITPQIQQLFSNCQTQLSRYMHDGYCLQKNVEMSYRTSQNNEEQFKVHLHEMVVETPRKIIKKFVGLDETPTTTGLQIFIFSKPSPNSNLLIPAKADPTIPFLDRVALYMFEQMWEGKSPKEWPERKVFMTELQSRFYQFYEEDELDLTQNFPSQDSSPRSGKLFQDDENLNVSITSATPEEESEDPVDISSSDEEERPVEPLGPNGLGLAKRLQLPMVPDTIELPIPEPKKIGKIEQLNPLIDIPKELMPPIEENSPDASPVKRKSSVGAQELQLSPDQSQVLHSSTEVKLHEESPIRPKSSVDVQKLQFSPGLPKLRLVTEVKYQEGKLLIPQDLKEAALGILRQLFQKCRDQLAQKTHLNFPLTLKCEFSSSHENKIELNVEIGMQGSIFYNSTLEDEGHPSVSDLNFTSKLMVSCHTTNYEASVEMWEEPSVAREHTLIPLPMKFAIATFEDLWNMQSKDPKNKEDWSTFTDLETKTASFWC